jgi:acetyl-CoA acetyltransferase
VAKELGIDLRYVLPRDGKASGVLVPIAAAVRALASGACDTIALVYSAASRSIGRRYGGQTYQGMGPDSYYYYHPWGWSSQAAHWALIFQHYMATFHVDESDLGSVAMAIRTSATLNENAIMRDPLTIEKYLESRYIVRPLHLFDMCLVNDGGVCLILRRSDTAGDTPHAPVLVGGWGYSEVPHSKMHFMVKERLRPQLQSAGRQALAMAGVDLAEVGHLQAYDPSTVHFINQLEGYGFVDVGTGVDFCKEGQIAIDGLLPSNTNGGLLSEAYMHGWNNIVESVRQLRHEAGQRQVHGVGASLFSVVTTESAHPILLRRGESRG